MFDIPPLILRDFTSTLVCWKSLFNIIKFIYSKVEISQNFVALSEYMNFIIIISDFQQTGVEVKSLRRSGGISNILINKNQNYFCLFKIQSLNTSVGKNSTHIRNRLYNTFHSVWLRFYNSRIWFMMHIILTSFTAVRTTKISLDKKYCSYK